ncbi:MAG TPA: hypothetical protein VLU92_09975 [Candidatus Dormibacteraeota bacterium]|nr:hypothetical protein [Candidatus Dormibacteraeota bacterium]
MNSPASDRHPTIWAFWLACAVAVAAGVAPIVLAGTSGRESLVIVPMLVAAAAYAGCALLQSQGKVVATALYFLAGLATLYGALSMLAVPLRLAVIGTCRPAPAVCAAGLERPLTAAENSGIGFAAALGIVAVFLGFFGLVTLYRRLNAGMPATPTARRILPFAPARTPEPAQPPPVRRIPPVVHSRPAAPEIAGPEPPPELAAPEPQLELPAPAPELELPPHVDVSQPAEAATEPAPASRPRRNRKPLKDPTTPDTSAT